MELNYENRVGWQKRLVAKIIDAIFFILISIFITTSLITKYFLDGEDSSMTFVLALNLTMLLYNITEGLLGATPGKMYKKIKIVREDGQETRTNDLMKRWAINNAHGIATLIWLITGVSFLNSISSILSLVLFVGIFFIFGKKKQGLHGRWTKTIVVNK